MWEYSQLLYKCNQLTNSPGNMCIGGIIVWITALKKLRERGKTTELSTVEITSLLSLCDFTLPI